MKEYNKKLGQKISEMRKELGLTQENLAKKIGINRIAISQIENGERKIDVQEIIQFSKIFNISSDVLLDLKKDVEISIQHYSNKKNKKKEIRISVPQRNIDKFKEVLIYILNKVGSKPNIGETVLYKLLYFIDFDFYEKYEEQLLGATYIKNHYGPTPKEFMQIIKEIDNKDIIKVKNSYFKYPQTKYLSLREADLTILKANEINTINNVLNRLSDMNAIQISDYAHKDVPWLTTEMGEIIDYESVFYRTMPYSVRNYEKEEF